MGKAINVRGIADETWHRFRVLAARRQTTLREQVIEAVNEFLDHHEQQEASC